MSVFDRGSILHFHCMSEYIIDVKFNIFFSSFVVVNFKMNIICLLLSLFAKSLLADEAVFQRVSKRFQPPFAIFVRVKRKIHGGFRALPSRGTREAYIY